MLSSIYIKNFAIIDEIEIDFHENMSVLTGETGAGKSILIDAINTVFGNKKISKISRNNSLDTEIICHFSILNKNILEILKEKDLMDDNNCVFRRKINIKNISKIYINDKLVSSGTARLIGDLIIDIHGQHENQLILSSDEQRNRLDNFINIGEKKLCIKNLLSDINNINKSLSETALTPEEYKEKVSLLEYEVKELENEVLEPDDYEKIYEDYRKLSNADILINKINQCKSLIESENNLNISSLLSDVNKNLEDIKNIDKNTDDIQSANINIQEEVRDLSKMLEKYEHSINVDNEKLALLNEKIKSLNNLSRKYGVNEKDLIKILYDKQDLLNNLIINKDNIDNKNKKIEENILNYHNIAKEISAIRIKKSVILEKKISEELKKLGMTDCQFKIDITTDKNLVNKNGYDKVIFLIKTNKKSKLLPLSEIASGGELSRLSLIIQLETRSNNDCETMIFDEIDTGIGGATSEVLGDHLSKLSENTQVLCVTHLAQVAAKSKHHYLVSKDKNISTTRLTYLDNEMRVNELARMIGGIKLTDKTLQLAKELIS
jgi:DNA repair protein RecN (Recombination protein N)